MNFAPNIDAFLTHVATVTRRAPATLVDGRAVAGAASTFQIRASVQTIGGRELQRLAEGSRVAERRRLYASTRLQVISASDVVTLDGEQWEVERVEVWDTLGNYFKAVIAKVGD